MFAPKLLFLLLVQSALMAFAAGMGEVLHPVRDQTKCLDVRGGVFSNGTPVQLYDCNGTPAQNWIIECDTGAIRLAGTSLCIDASSPNPQNGQRMKIWYCYDNLPAQSWEYGMDDTIKLKSADQCLDLKDGGLANGNIIQTWTCARNNTNQIWIV